LGEGEFKEAAALKYEFLRGKRERRPHRINYASEFPTFEEIAEVNPTGVQWKGLALGNRLLDHG